MPSLDAGRQAASWPRGCIPVAGSPGCSAGASPSIQTSDIPVPRTRPRPRPDSGSQSQTHAHRWPSPILGASAWPPTRSPGQPPGARSTPPVPKTRPLLPALHQAAPWPTSQAESGAGLLPRGLRSPRRGQDGKRDAAGGQRWCWQRGVASGGAPAVLPAHLTFRGGLGIPTWGAGWGWTRWPRVTGRELLWSKCGRPPAASSGSLRAPGTQHGSGCGYGGGVSLSSPSPLGTVAQARGGPAGRGSGVVSGQLLLSVPCPVHRNVLSPASTAGGLSVASAAHLRAVSIPLTCTENPSGTTSEARGAIDVSQGAVCASPGPAEETPPTWQLKRMEPKS